MTEENKEKCMFCNGEMAMVTEDEGGMIISWCYNCGSLSLGMEGEEKEFYQVGKKPDFF